MGFVQEDPFCSELEEENFKSRVLVVEFLTHKAPRLLVSLVLFLGGIGILFLRVPGWSLLLGIPSIQAGIVLLIFAFEEVADRHVGFKDYHLVSCSICGKLTSAPFWQKEKVCETCQKKIAARLEEEG
jgi:hypothetical protein